MLVAGDQIGVADLSGERLGLGRPARTPSLDLDQLHRGKAQRSARA